MNRQYVSVMSAIGNNGIWPFNKIKECIFSYKQHYAATDLKRKRERKIHEKLSGSAYSSEEELKMHHFGGIERWLSSIKERSCIFAIIICTSSKFELGADEA